MAAAELTRSETELERIARWRAEELERAGTRRRRPRCSRRADVDLHYAIDLLGTAAPGARAPDPALTRPARLRRAPSLGQNASCGCKCTLAFASIPSPSSGTLDLGPLTIHMYGLTLLARSRLHLDHRPPLGRPRRRLGPDLPRRRLGRRRRDRRRAALPPRDELERGAGRVVGAVRDLEGRPRRLGRDRRGVLVGGFIAKRPGANVWLLADCRAPGPARRAGDRPDRQLVEPGALRQADRPAVGARDRLRAPARRVPRRRDLPPDVPLRGALGSRRRRRCCS